MAGFADKVSTPSVKFAEVGFEVSGPVVSIDEVAVPHFDQKTGRISGNEVNEETGETVMQMDVTIETIIGKRTIHTGGAIAWAIGRALAEIGATDLEEGDELTVKYTGNGEQTVKGRNAPKQYAATVVKAL